MFLEASAAGKAAEGRLGDCSGLQSAPSGSSSGHRGGSAEPDAVCELLWGWRAQVDTSAKVVGGPESVPGAALSWPGHS